MYTPEPFGRYTLVDSIGAGGMAEVFRATLQAQAGLEKTLVVKRILKGLSSEEAFIEMFIDEARIAALLQHPNVVAVFDFGKVDEHWFMAMEWVDGLNLHRLLRHLDNRDTPMPVDVAVFIAHEAAKGLHYAHQLTDAEGAPLHVVHRDICPQNLLIGWRGEVKVADFGIAKSAASSFTTRGHSLKGHTSYMSPEQTRGADLDGRSDVFSLGVVLWEVLAGQRLFKADDPVLTLEAIRIAEVPPLRSLREEVSPELASVVHACLAVNPDDRPESARELRRALANAATATPDELRERFAAWMAETCEALIVQAQRRRRGHVVLPEPPSVDPEDVTQLGVELELEQTVQIAAPPPRPQGSPSGSEPWPPRELTTPSVSIANSAPTQSNKTDKESAEPPRRRRALLLLPLLVLLFGGGVWLSQRGGGSATQQSASVDVAPATPPNGVAIDPSAAPVEATDPGPPKPSPLSGDTFNTSSSSAQTSSEGPRGSDGTPTNEGEADAATGSGGGEEASADPTATNATSRAADEATRGADPSTPDTRITDTPQGGNNRTSAASVGADNETSNNESNETLPTADAADKDTPPSDTLNSDASDEAPIDEPPVDEAPSADTPATISVRLASGWGQLRVDGKRVRGSTPFDDLPLAPGPHLIQVEVPSTGRVWSREVTLEPGEHLELVFD